MQDANANAAHVAPGVLDEGGCAFGVWGFLSLWGVWVGGLFFSGRVLE